MTIFYTQRARLVLLFLAALLCFLIFDSARAEALPGASLGHPDRIYNVAPGEPISRDGDIDSDGRVPIYFTCGFAGLGLYTFDRDTRQGVIRINECALRRIGASVAERRETMAHEEAHARGFGHHESTPRRNEAYYP